MGTNANHDCWTSTDDDVVDAILHLALVLYRNERFVGKYARGKGARLPYLLGAIAYECGGGDATYEVLELALRGQRAVEQAVKLRLDNDDDED